MTELERRYERLLRLYPAAYRQARGAEMLAVLMDAAPPDRRRPEWREVRGLVIGALRARAGADGRRTAWQSWRVALRMAALMLLLQSGADALWQIRFIPVAETVAVAAAVVLATMAVLRGAYLAATLVTAGAFVVQVVTPRLVPYRSADLGYYLSPSWRLVLVVALLVPLIGRGRVVAPRALNLMLLVPVVSAMLEAHGAFTQNPLPQASSAAVWQTLAIAAVLWSVIDERVAMTFGLAFLSVAVSRASYLTLHGTLALWAWTLLDMAVLAILPLLDIAVGATVAARRARI